MQGVGQNGPRCNEKWRVFEKLSAGGCRPSVARCDTWNGVCVSGVCNIDEVEAGLLVRKVNVVGCQQAMALRADVADFEFHVPRQLALDAEVVLRGILGTHVGLEVAEEQDRLKVGPILRGSRFRRNNAIVGIGSWGAALRQKGLVELGLREDGTTAKWRFGAELLQHQLLDGVIEQPEPCANAGFAGIPRTPRDADAGGECLVIGLGHSRRNASIAGEYHSDRVLRGAVGSGGGGAGIDGADLAGTERLYVMRYIRKRSVQLPTQPVVQGNVWFDFPAILGEQIKPGVAHPLDLTGTLTE